MDAADRAERSSDRQFRPASIRHVVFPFAAAIFDHQRAAHQRRLGGNDRFAGALVAEFDPHHQLGILQQRPEIAELHARRIADRCRAAPAAARPHRPPKPRHRKKANGGNDQRSHADAERAAENSAAKQLASRIGGKDGGDANRGEGRGSEGRGRDGRRAVVELRVSFFVLRPLAPHPSPLTPSSAPRPSPLCHAAATVPPRAG